METQHLKLTPHRQANLLALLKSTDEYEKSAGMRIADGVRDYLLAASPDFIAQLRAATTPDPWRLGFAVVQLMDNVVIGLCGFTGPPDADGIAEIGYCIAPAYQGKGYATETAQALVAYAVASRQCSVVRALTLAETNASTRILEKCGFKKTGTIMDPENNLVWRWELTLAPHSKAGGKATRADMTRREAARIIGAGMAGTLLPIHASRGQAKSESSAMLTRTIPSSGERLPVIGLGTWRAFDVDLSADSRRQLEEVLSLFVKLGGRVIDSSPMYGRSEEVIGELNSALGIREKLFLATKVWTRGKQSGIQSIERSMALFRTNLIDLIQVHNLVDVNTQLATLKESKQQGRIRYIGITHYESGALSEIEKLMRTEKFDFLQINYSLMEPEAEGRVLSLAKERGIAVIANRPFGAGDLFSKVRSKPLPDWAAEFDCRSWAQFFLKWIVANPAITCAIPATDKPHHLEDNMQGGIGRLPDANMRRRMVEFVSSW